jgi:transposase
MLNMGQQYTILTLHNQGKTNAAIARQLDCSRHTVENVLKRGYVTEKQTRQKSSVVTPYKEQIEKWLKDPKITRLRMYEMLQDEQQVTFSYDALRKFVKKHLLRPEAFGVQEHLPGAEMEVDFGDITVYLTEEKKWVKYQLLAFVLPFSGKKYYELCLNQQLETFCLGFQNAFTNFCGVPKKAKVDNLKAAVIKNARYELEFNQGFLEFAYHYGFIINPCTPSSPEQKGTVEAGVKYAQQNFVPGRTFTNGADVRRQLNAWTEKVNTRVHGTTKEVINDRFARFEKERLQALPTEAFSFFNRCERIVGANCHIHFENNYYSTPFSYVGKQVTVRWNQAIIRIIHQGEEVALHKLEREGVGKYVTERHHLPSHKLYSEAEYRHYHEEKMTGIGRNASQYLLLLLQAQPGYWRQTLRPIYGFVAEYGPEAVNKALGRALTYNALDTRIIRHILDGKLYEIAETVEIPVFTDTTNSRELTYYEA